MQMTPREFHLLMDAKEAKFYDELEMMSYQALMVRNAYHSTKKVMKAEDFFKRPHDNTETSKEEVQKQREWLHQSDLGEGVNLGD
jgi:hypothetical protein